MRRYLHLVLLIMVAVCGLHVAEPVQAHGEAAHHQIGSGPDLDHDGDGARDAHAIHHHCPVAPDQMAGAEPDAAVRDAGLLFPHVATFALLDSQAPPLQPPSA